ncbi:hypothetical protein GF386_05810 [Candidatus Pacearchaeota archaeon]|nr:hypothetical protein [Candidatus Pacearchaeota archaeon]MBD3283609.1 hypothetical protein [Candidatus Pacearchaeota archaeon]
MSKEIFELETETREIYTFTTTTRRRFLFLGEETTTNSCEMQDREGKQRVLKYFAYVSSGTADRVVEQSQRYLGEPDKLAQLVDNAQRMSLGETGGIVICVAALEGNLGIKPSSRVKYSRRIS